MPNWCPRLSEITKPYMKEKVRKYTTDQVGCIIGKTKKLKIVKCPFHFCQQGIINHIPATMGMSRSVFADSVINLARVFAFYT